MNNHKSKTAARFLSVACLIFAACAANAWAAGAPVIYALNRTIYTFYSPGRRRLKQAFQPATTAPFKLPAS